MNKENELKTNNIILFTIYTYIQTHFIVILMKLSATPSRQLNQSQLTILDLLYKFRFGTTTLLAKHLGLKNGTYISAKLNVLVERGYIGRNYDSSYKLRGQPASYYLLPKAFRVLKQQVEVSPKVLKSIYKDRSASERFIKHNLTVFKTYAALGALNGDRMDFFTKSDLRDDQYDYFPQPIPDAFISIANSNQPRAKRKYFFLDVLADETPFFVTIRKVSRYLEYADARAWETATSSKLPVILLTCESISLEKRLHKRMAALIPGSESALILATTTNELIESVNMEEDAVWRIVAGTSRLNSLSEIK